MDGLSDVHKIENHDFGPLLIPTELMDHIYIVFMAGATGLEPVECQSQSLVPYRLGYAPSYGAPRRIRTPGTRIRSPLLYPTEL